MVTVDRGEAVFVMPRLAVGKVIFSPQAPRGERWEEKEKALYHSTSAAPSHFYLAAYLWLREQQQADALVHFGTHGTQEWLPGKERGLSATHDYPMLAVGDVRHQGGFAALFDAHNVQPTAIILHSMWLPRQGMAIVGGATLGL